MRGRERDVCEQERRESELYIPSNTTVGGREEREARRRKFIFGGEARRNGRLSRLATVYRLPQRRKPRQNTTRTGTDERVLAQVMFLRDAGDGCGVQQLGSATPS